MTKEKNHYQDNQIEEIKNSIKVINGELGEIRDSMRNTEIKIAKTENDIGWLKQHFWIIAGASITAVITGLLNLL